MAMCSIPELMPNKFRHIGICLSDGFVFVIVVIGPIVGRVSHLSATECGASVADQSYHCSMLSTQERGTGSTSTGAVSSLSSCRFSASPSCTSHLLIREVSHGETVSGAWTTLGCSW